MMIWNEIVQFQFIIQMRLMLNREELLKEQVEIYQQQYSEVEANIGGTTKNFQHFRKEIERVTKELKQVNCCKIFLLQHEQFLAQNQRR